MALAAVVAVSSSNEDDKTFDFDTWLAKDVVPSKTSVDEVVEAVTDLGRHMSVPDLVSCFPSLSRALFLIATEKFSIGKTEEALAVLDAHWEFVVKADAMFKFPREVVRSLSLESEIHGSKRDISAMSRSNRILWKLLKQYQWIGGEREFESLRTRVSASLALSSAIDGDCMAAEYFLGDAVQFAREVAVRRGDTDVKDAESLAKDIFKLLQTSLQSYFYLMYWTDSKCKNTFKRSAKAVYDVVFAIDPSVLPHWRDLKRNLKKEMKQKYEKEKEEIRKYGEIEKMYATKDE